METKTFTLADYAFFCEKIGEWQGHFEFVDLQIQDKFTGENLPADLVEYVLNNKISYFPDFYKIAMTTFKHSRIIRNTRISIEKKVEGQEIVLYSEGRNVLMIKGNIRIPDIVMVNENDEQMDERDNLQNPLAAFEVLSPSTAHIDFNEKLAEYQALPTLQTYLIISQEMPKIWQYSRNDNNVWILSEYEDLNECFMLDFLPIPVAVSLKEVYEKISF